MIQVPELYKSKRSGFTVCKPECGLATPADGRLREGIPMGMGNFHVILKLLHYRRTDSFRELRNRLTEPYTQDCFKTNPSGDFVTTTTCFMVRKNGYLFSNRKHNKGISNRKHNKGIFGT